MDRLRLTPASEEIVAEWSEQASREDRLRMAKFLETLADGTWRERWWNEQYAADPDMFDVRPDEGLYVHMRILLDEESGCPCAEFVFIHRNADRDMGDE